MRGIGEGRLKREVINLVSDTIEYFAVATSKKIAKNVDKKVDQYRRNISNKVNKVQEKVDQFGRCISKSQSIYLVRKLADRDGIIYPGYDYKRDKDNNIIVPYSKAQINKRTTECKKTLVVFIGGFADSIYQPLLDNVFAPYEKKYGHGNERRQDVCYSEHGGGKVPPLMKEWFKANQKIVLVGHSWGGDRVVQLALKNPDIPIELLVTLDPVSYSSQHIKPKNVKRWINSYVQYEVKCVVSDLFKDISTIKNGNSIAVLGHPWQYCNGADKNFIVNKNKNGTLNKISHANASAMFRNSGAENEVIKI